MPKADFYWYAACSQCRDARKELLAKGFELDEREYFKQQFTESELRDLLKKTKLTPRDVFSFKSPSVKALKLDPQNMTDDDMLKWMIREPRLIRRPLTVIKNKPIIGYDRTTFDKL